KHATRTALAMSERIERSMVYRLPFIGKLGSTAAGRRDTSGTGLTQKVVQASGGGAFRSQRRGGPFQPIGPHGGGEARQARAGGRRRPPAAGCARRVGLTQCHSSSAPAPPSENGCRFRPPSFDVFIEPVLHTLDARASPRLRQQRQ